jgi:hypothetical protein
MPEDWTEVSPPRERVETIVETMQRPRTAEEIAEYARVEVPYAFRVIEDLLAEGMMYQYDEDRYDVRGEWLLADEIRRLGTKTDDGILVPHEVIDALESGEIDSRCNTNNSK